MLSGRRISNLILSQPEHADLIFRDCEITGAFYGVDAWFGQGTPPSDPNARTRFEYCTFDRADAACIAGTNYTVLHCNMKRGVDIAKSHGNAEIYASYMHSLWDPDGDAHGDVLQIQSGDDILVHWNTMICLNAADSPFRPGGIGSGTTQFGAPQGDCTNVRLEDNWVDGGVYTLRGAGQWNDGIPYQALLTFRRNKHGRNYGSGPETLMGSFDSGRAVSDYDASNVWQDTGLPVNS